MNEKNIDKILQHTGTVPQQHLIKTGIENKIYKGHSHALLNSKKVGSITVEASLCVPIFFLVVFSLFYIVEGIYKMNRVQDGLVDCANEYAVFGTKLGSIAEALDDGVLVKYGEDGQASVCCANYSIKVPVLGSKFFKLSLYQQIVVNDYAGRSMISKGGGEGDEFVYVTRTGKVYHLDRKCTYLKPSIKEISGYEVESKRNMSGGRYKSCERCCRNVDAKELDVVYITTYGDRYHSVNTCPGLKRDVRRIKRSEAGGLHACSKCGNE